MLTRRPENNCLSDLPSVYMLFFTFIDLIQITRKNENTANLFSACRNDNF